MYQVQNLTDDSKQKQTLVLPDGTFIQLSIYFCPMQFGWFIREISYGDFVLNGLRICNNPNMLYQWRNLIPFGLACFTENNREPSLQEDFSTEVSKLFILTEAEVTAYVEFLSE